MAFRLRWPTQYDRILLGFGIPSPYYFEHGLPGHEGIDFTAPVGSEIYACADGVVSEIRRDSTKKTAYGNQIRIIHATSEGEFTTVYTHLQKMLVKKGDKVKAGQVIGLADDTGYGSSGSQLHLTLKKKGATAKGETIFPYDIIDPTPYLDPFPGSSQPLDRLKYLADVTVPDKTVMRPGETFRKVWRVQNDGTTLWGNGYQLVGLDDRMGAPAEIPLPRAKPGEIVTLELNLTAPAAPGFHRSTWSPKNAKGERFRGLVYTLIEVSDQKPVNVVVDLSRWNRVDDFQLLKAAGIEGVIHKATQGTTSVDPRYADRRQMAKTHGLMWGAYHFGIGGNPIGQAKHFLNTVQPDSKTLMSLDIEAYPKGADMTVAEAEQFVSYIHNQTGRWPLLYSRRGHLREFINDDEPTLLSQCPLWVAAWSDSPIMPVQWSTWTFWQYTDGRKGPEPRLVKGFKVSMPRDQFNGTLQQLRKFWGY